ncbi:cytochrome oxidase subunit 3 (mitochondrion) [Schizosaccharomyces pombe]|uniref:Cytochrome c oxidase subunit 3 n=1 Tax=Schizosaccharomyces pombe TaxID=4896 RepID=A0A516IJZ4_SCHPM|nr:cytochrome oxidase subunit 3 [Schizosaccharomyces pombe]QDP17097.1 cytochrome oxidase subunit 3 [Schizosaccharomyces pombe]QDP17108.1 cytochrome oxidase subunit 3 [Schizosaccharomyces pombe]QDP17119.1 cytochrome oxidase subunit 3 [Schizosaccharomyces pombe]QDP17130.1 cytochrome oxidase subunit 3 [Schizosaccharomyces pombe]
MNLSTKFQGHPYHIVSASPWPFFLSVVLFFNCLAATLYLHGYKHSSVFFGISFLGLLATMYLWFRDMSTEANIHGAHTKAVTKGLKIGFMLFLISETFLFASIFWAFFHSSLSPTFELGAVWPPVGIADKTIDPLEVPLLNTVILLTSGASLTYAHYSLIARNRENALKGLYMTIALSFLFLGGQAYEYWNAPFTISDSVYGASFYFATGLHGIHIIVGTILLLVATYNIYTYHLTNTHHNGFECGIYYWHFCDVVWLFLYLTIYIWGS